MLNTISRGIFQSDIIIRTAIVEGLRLVKEQPWLLDFAFASLVQDDLASGEYGAAELEKVKNWITETDIPVTMAYNKDKLVTPLIAISLEDSVEAESTLGDVSKEGPEEDVDMSTIIAMPKPIAGPFTPISYDSNTGIMEVANSVDLSGVYPGMWIVDPKTNQGYAIEGVGGQSLTIAAGIIANFTNAIIAADSSLYRVTLESCEFKEVYRIDIYVSGNPTLLLYLHALLVFIIMRYKESLLEARGYERSILASKGITGFQTANGPEFIYQRTLLLTGFVKQYWPKDITGKISSISIGESTNMITIDESGSQAEIGVAIDAVQSVGPQ